MNNDNDKHMSLYSSAYKAHDTILLQKRDEIAAQEERKAKRRALETCYDDLTELPALSSYMQITDALDSQASLRKPEQNLPSGNKAIVRDGFERMQRCRMALEALDQGGWKRSYHQRLFHEAYIAACARPFWKLDPPGAFARAHQKILEMNSWESLSQEILISTPRRLGVVIWSTHLSYSESSYQYCYLHWMWPRIVCIVSSLYSKVPLIYSILYTKPHPQTFPGIRSHLIKNPCQRYMQCHVHCC